MNNENKDMKGIAIGQTDHKLSQFAEDTELLQEGNRTFEESIQVIVDFGNKSGF